VAVVNDIVGVASAEVSILRSAGVHVDHLRVPLFGASLSRPLKTLAMPVRLVGYLPIILRLRRGRYDIVHVHFVSQGIVGVASGRPYVLHAHGSDLHQNFKRPLLRWLSNRLLGRASAILYVTPNLQKYLTPFAGRARLVGNPIATGPPVSPPAAIKRALIFARLEPIKGVQLIFDGLEEFARLVEVTAINWGPRAGQYRRQYGSVVRFIDPVPASGVMGLLQTFDVVIGQMHQGILSLSELEALAAGRPVLTRINLALYADDPPPVIRVENAAEIASALRRLAREPALLRQTVEEGQAWVRRNHGIAGHRAVLMDTYGKVLGARIISRGRVADESNPSTGD
jgi:glycosyltransferase involved in cell wall biosynthesis